MPGLLAAAARAARRLARLVVPVQCPGCGRVDVRCCGACRESLHRPPRRRERDAPRLDRLDGVAPLPVWSPAAYDGPVRGIVLAWKDHGRIDLDPVVGAAMRVTGARLGTALLLAADGPVMVVPAPSTRSATRARGRYVVGGLALAFAAGLREAGCPARVAPVLSRRRGADQVGRGRRARGDRLAGVRRRPRARLGGAVCVLVDDVLTTGATLAACESVLSASGAHVLGAVVLAATPPPPGTVLTPGPDTPATRLSNPSEPG